MINQQQQQKENTLNQDNAFVAIYPTHVAAEAAVKKLQQSGFDMKKLMTQPMPKQSLIAPSLKHQNTIRSPAMNHWLTELTDPQ